MKSLGLIIPSLCNRKTTFLLTVCAIAMSVCLLLSVDSIRRDARNSFINTISGTDLIVGARSGGLQLLLYSVFRIGNATNNVSWTSYQTIINDPQVNWAIPLSLGDSHRGYRVLGTSRDYFKHFQYAGKQRLSLAEGVVFDQAYDVVLGASVAKSLGYELDQRLVISHGLSDVAFAQHDEYAFKVVGILNPTGTPVDQTLHLSLAGLEAVHGNWRAESETNSNLDIDAVEPQSISAFMLGLKSKLSIFKTQRAINEYSREPLLAILPGVTLQELWDMIGVVEKILFVIALMVVLSGFIGMLAVILASLNERRREMAILRAVGARPGDIFSLFLAEAVIVAGSGAVLGLFVFYMLKLLASHYLTASYGLYLGAISFSWYELRVILLVLLAGLITGLIPAMRAYQFSLADGMSQRV